MQENQKEQSSQPLNDELDLEAWAELQGRQDKLEDAIKQLAANQSILLKGMQQIQEGLRAPSAPAALPPSSSSLVNPPPSSSIQEILSAFKGFLSVQNEMEKGTFERMKAAQMFLTGGQEEEPEDDVAGEALASILQGFQKKAQGTPVAEPPKPPPQPPSTGSVEGVPNE